MSMFEKASSFDRIDVHSPEILEEISTDNGRRADVYTSSSSYASGSSWHHPCYMSAPMPKTSSRTSVAPKSAGPGSLHRRMAATSTPGSKEFPNCRYQSWLNEEFVKGIQEKPDNDTRSIRNMCAAVLENEESLSDSIDRYLEYNDISNENRKRMLYKKWSERVYSPLKEKIDAEMNCSNYKEHVKRKNDLYQKYLDHRNKKGMVFLDVYSQDEYDPMQLNEPRPGPLKAKVHSLNRTDPLCFQDFKRIMEEQETLRCQTGHKSTPDDVRKYLLPAEPLVPLGRAKTTCKTWLRMPIHNIDSPPRLKSRQKVRPSTNQSQIDFDKWKNTLPNTSTLKLIDLELQSQKKRYYPEKYTGRRILEWPERHQQIQQTQSTEVA